MDGISKALMDLAAACVSAGVPILLVWLNQHLKIMQNAAMNQVITSAASRFAALLIEELSAAAGTLTETKVGDPKLAAAGRRLMEAYPQFTERLNMNNQIAQQIVLGEAKKLMQTAPTVTTQVIKELNP